MPNPFALLPSPCPPSPSACCIYSGSPLSSTACHGRPQPKTPLDCYIKDKLIEERPDRLGQIGSKPDGFLPGTDLVEQRYKEDFDKLSAAEKTQYEKKALLSLRQYQKVLCFTLSAPPCTLSTSLMYPALHPRLGAALSVPRSTQPYLHSRPLRALCIVGMCP